MRTQELHGVIVLAYSDVLLGPALDQRRILLDHICDCRHKWRLVHLKLAAALQRWEMLALFLLERRRILFHVPHAHIVLMSCELHIGRRESVALQ